MVEPRGAGAADRSELSPHAVRVPRFDLGGRPHLVLFELTRACDLACQHCRAEAGSIRDPGELTTGEVGTVLDDLASLGAPRPVVVLTGGDPLMRPDLDEIVSADGGSGCRWRCRRRPPSA